jgi:hypothetical protein
MGFCASLYREARGVFGPHAPKNVLMVAFLHTKECCRRRISDDEGFKKRQQGNSPW